MQRLDLRSDLERFDLAQRDRTAASVDQRLEADHVVYSQVAEGLSE